eukprot:365492-Chlamydomonas_euryale.AAC.14
MSCELSAGKSLFPRQAAPTLPLVRQSKREPLLKNPPNLLPPLSRRRLASIPRVWHGVRYAFISVALSHSLTLCRAPCKVGMQSPFPTHVHSPTPLFYRAAPALPLPCTPCQAVHTHPYLSFIPPPLLFTFPAHPARLSKRARSTASTMCSGRSCRFWSLS